VEAAHVRGPAGGGNPADKAFRGAQGRAFAATEEAHSAIKALATSPDIASNPAAQLGLADNYIRMVTGRAPTVAQYKKLLGAVDARDLASIVAGVAPSHPIMGPDLIKRITSSTDTIYNSKKAALQDDPFTDGDKLGSSHTNPAKPKTKQEAAALPKGTWFMDPAGNVIQRQ
jgi:hypothetical protein